MGLWDIVSPGRFRLGTGRWAADQLETGPLELWGNWPSALRYGRPRMRLEEEQFAAAHPDLVPILRARLRDMAL